MNLHHLPETSNQKVKEKCVKIFISKIESSHGWSKDKTILKIKTVEAVRGGYKVIKSQ